jgi:hypothetical protein
VVVLLCTTPLWGLMRSRGHCLLAGPSWPERRRSPAWRRAVAGRARVHAAAARAPARWHLAPSLSCGLERAPPCLRRRAWPRRSAARRTHHARNAVRGRRHEAPGVARGAGHAAQSAHTTTGSVLRRRAALGHPRGLHAPLHRAHHAV